MTCGGAFVVVVDVVVLRLGVFVVVVVLVVPLGAFVVVLVLVVPCGAVVVPMGVVVVPTREVVVPTREVVVPTREVVVPTGAVIVLVLGDEVVLGGGAATFRARTFVAILVEHVNRVPPLLPVPLHWLTRTGTAALTLDEEDTEHTAAEPPPVTEPLH